MNIALALAALFLSTTAHAQGFDWGADCDAGTGQFVQQVPNGATATVGVIPTGKKDVEVLLHSPQDVDVQLIDVATGTELIAWPNGLLSGPSEECSNFQGLSFCYSGYNGGQTSSTLGNEYIRINGETTREVEMRVFGYAAGLATVDYRFNPVNTCNETGSGAFRQRIAHQATVVVGDIPAGKTNVAIELDAAMGADVDVQLWDGTTAIVAWPNGLLNGPAAQSVQYRGMTIEWSGYNGIDGNWGHEAIRISGTIPADLTMKAFGYQAGTADVTYEWGVGVGDTCGGIGALQCDDGLFCKEWMSPTIPDAAGVCHTEDWCGSDATAATDCSGLPHIMTVGSWGCTDTFTCEWVTNTGAGVGETCATTADCGFGLVCLGEIAYGTGLFCVDDSMYGTFSSTQSVAIPDVGHTSTSVDVQGLATVPVDVVLTLDIDHPRKSDLVVTLENFNGYRQVVWNREATPSNEVVITAFPSDDAVNGLYTLHVEDAVSGQTGTLRGWDLYIVSNWD